MKITKKIAKKIRKTLGLCTVRQAPRPRSSGSAVRWLLRESKPVDWCLRFARRAFDAAEVLKADVYVAHGVQALPAADMVARATGGRLICDGIEIPAFASRITAPEIGIRPTWRSWISPSRATCGGAMRFLRSAGP